MRRQRVLGSVLACVVAAMSACGPRDAPPRDTVGATARAIGPASAASDWVPELGQLLVVPSDSLNTGIVLFPATPSPGSISTAHLTLLSASGDSNSARASLVVSDSQVCGEAPTVRLTGPATIPWSVGLSARSAAPLRLDSIEALPAADSARHAAELARLASALPMSRGSRFTGLPFVVFSARRFEAHGRHVVVAHLVRRLPQEATPWEEHTLVIAERSAAAPEEPYVVTHHQRSDGTEETAEQFEVLSAIRGSGTTLLLLARDQEARTRYEILERQKTGGWRPRWSRTLAC
jgi:hypothetical protein